MYCIWWIVFIINTVVFWCISSVNCILFMLGLQYFLSSIMNSNLILRVLHSYLALLRATHITLTIFHIHPKCPPLLLAIFDWNKMLFIHFHKNGWIFEKNQLIRSTCTTGSNLIHTFLRWKSTSSLKTTSRHEKQMSNLMSAILMHVHF